MGDSHASVKSDHAFPSVEPACITLSIPFLLLFYKVNQQLTHIQLT